MEVTINNLVINYKKTGHGQPVILMHGWGQNLEMMYTIENNLNDRYTVYNLDLPGFGYSDEPDFPYTISDYVVFLKEFISVNKITAPILIGHSFGCRIALKYASENDNVSRMILTGAAGLKSRKSLMYYPRVVFYKIVKKIKNVPFLKHYIQEYMENSGSEDYRNSSPTMKEVLKNTINEDLEPVLAKIKVPTLLIFGSEDDATPLWMAEVLNTKIERSKLLVYPGASHYAYLERLNEFKNDCDAFLSGGDDDVR